MLDRSRMLLRRQRIAAILTLAGVAFSLVGCDEADSTAIVCAAQPFYTRQDIATDAGLLGTWQYEEEITFTFAPGEKNTYDVTIGEDEGQKHFTSKFEGHLFRLGPDLFLDLYPASVPEGSEFFVLHFFRCHTVMKIELQDNQLQMMFLNPSWLTQQLKTGAVTLPHASSGDILLLTASTQELQELLFLNANDETAFEEAIEFVRVNDKEEP